MACCLVCVCRPYERPGLISNSEFQPGPALAIGGIWGVSQQRGELFLSAFQTFGISKSNFSLGVSTFVGVLED